ARRANCKSRPDPPALFLRPTGLPHLIKGVDPRLPPPFGRALRLAPSFFSSTNRTAWGEKPWDLRTREPHVVNRMRASPMWILAPEQTFADKSNPLGASTMIVDPCSNQPIS